MTPKARSLIRKLFWQVARAGAVGAVGTVVQYGVLALSVSVLSLPAYAGSAKGFILGALVNYWLNRVVVFNSSRKHRVALPRFFATALVGFVCNAVPMYFFAKTSPASIWSVQLATTAGVFVLTFFINKLWTFRVDKPQASKQR